MSSLIRTFCIASFLAAIACPPTTSPRALPLMPGLDCAHDPVQFPAFDKTCGATIDCALVFHTVSCCGGQMAVGIRSSERASFDAARVACDGDFDSRHCPVCATRPPTSLEDGTSSWRDEPIVVECREGRCLSRLRPP
jgi:hypothetical protein